jgi:hypothetical protein
MMRYPDKAENTISKLPHQMKQQQNEAAMVMPGLMLDMLLPREQRGKAQS